MDIQIKGTINDISAMMISSERYAMGRRTYIVSWTCEFIKNNMHLLTDKDINVIISDIKNSIDYGNDCDKVEWFNLLNSLEEYRSNVHENRK